MPSYLWYKQCLDEFIESEHPRDGDGKFTSSGQENSNLPAFFSSRRVERGVKKINLPPKEAAKCAEAIEAYTGNADHGDISLIDKAIYNSDAYNGKTYSGIEKEFDRDFNIGDRISGRLISWSKEESVAKDFAGTKKMLIIDKNPGLDVSDMSYEPDEQEVLTATGMSFEVKEIRHEDGFEKICVEYLGAENK